MYITALNNQTEVAAAAVDECNLDKSQARNESAIQVTAHTESLIEIPPKGKYSIPY